MSIIKFHQDLKVYQESFKTAMEIFELTKIFPKEELYSLADQIRRSSRSVSVNISEAWGKRKYEKSFVAKLTDSEGEARETQSWLDFALACKYINEEQYNNLNKQYNHIIGMFGDYDESIRKVVLIRREISRRVLEWKSY
ncbi:four helix bundle protein [Chryseobacterium indoltheticum]|uniref:four helix bundle protein n=1 Tax=Chryseobacterium indoltheticum TaxID=254 RepID=UPI001914B5F6|nr:four helix bundle protein [Chryseobacterium indoltheticum]QQQ26696.1 four helix bundle protein [Chryseobacterium indoltheticum]